MTGKDIILLAPVDIQIEILSCIDEYRQLVRCLRVSKAWQRLLTSPVLEPVYLRLVQQKWPKLFADIKRRFNSEPHQSPLLNYRDILLILGENSANIRKGQLHEAGSFTAPYQIGKSNVCYAEGYLAVYADTDDPNYDTNSIHLYDLSILRTGGGSEITGRRIVCPGSVLRVAIANGSLAYIAFDNSQDAKILSFHIGLQDLVTLSTRTCVAEAICHGKVEFATTLSAEGMDAFTREDRGRSTKIPVPDDLSRTMFCTNGRLVVCSISHLTHCTVWDMSSPLDATITGKTISLDPGWCRLMKLCLETSQTLNGYKSFERYMSVDDRGDIYVNDRHSATMIHQARQFCSFRGPGGQDCFYFVPSPSCELQIRGESENDDVEPIFDPTLNDSILDQYYPRVLLDRKLRREVKDCYERSTKEECDEEFEYELGYLGELSIYPLPREQRYQRRAERTRVIPEVTDDCVVWQCLSGAHELTFGSNSYQYVRNVTVIGVRPVVLSELENPPENHFDRRALRRWASEHVNPRIEAPTSIHEFTIEKVDDIEINFAGDEHAIVLSHYQYRNPDRNPDRNPEGTKYGYQWGSPPYATLIRLFRYGDAKSESTSYTVRYTDGEVERPNPRYIP
ncbi:hypothetical protein H072_8365 [Dactylellina haptotyla CBS 200.50]|uniref:F-box domain-containing protein n=1 Tax=Dactylellina haptotyla (strain CBS 200.50) TaxID=1284197 RepID=S8BRR0_DACHA|nr:hypothetical protein H072_8365 [Dactylellina haptotyla CBS 200.50]